MVKIDAIREHVVAMLNKGLSENLTYHNAGHALDVAEQCMAIAAAEGITDEQALLELEIAALYHDTGFLFKYKGHELLSCVIAKKELPDFGLQQSSIENICEIIMATQMPQSPKNHFQQIICDADLDYLGRNDFFILSKKLQQEFIEYQIVSDDEEWNKERISFFQSHAYFTTSQKIRRDLGKQEHLEELKIKD